MREYVKQLEDECNEKIKKLKKEMQDKILKKLKDYWTPGDRVKYEDRDGVIEGKFISIDNIGKVAVMVNKEVLILKNDELNWQQKFVECHPIVWKLIQIIVWGIIFSTSSVHIEVG